VKLPFLSRKEHEIALMDARADFNVKIDELKRQVSDMEPGSTLFWLFAENRPVVTSTLMGQIASLAEVDAHLVDLVRRLMVNQQGFQNTLPTEQDRLLAVSEVRLLSWNDPVTERMMTLWTDYGFGMGWIIKADDEDAQVIWNEYYTARRNKAVLGADSQQELSDTVLRDGEFFFVHFVDVVAGGRVTTRVILTDEVKEIITDPEDKLIPVYYRREFTMPEAGMPTILYYLDMHLDPDDPDDAMLIARAKLPSGARVAHEEKTGTFAAIQSVAHRRKGINELRGWPMPATGTAWARAYKQFLENRAAVARAVAAVVDKLVAKGGSTAMSVIQAKFNAALDATGRFGVSDPPMAGGTWLQNEAIDRQRMPLTTGAGDAQIDGGALLSMAALPAGLPPHLMGRGEVVRMAVAEAMDAPIFRQFTRYQSFWTAVWKDLGDFVLRMHEKYSSVEFSSRDVAVQTDNIKNIDIDDIMTLTTLTLTLVEAGLLADEDVLQNMAVALMRLAMLTVGIKDPDTILGLTANDDEDTITVERKTKEPIRPELQTRILMHAMQGYLDGAVGLEDTTSFLKEVIETW
jgi:hypothetical protein